MSIPLLQSQAIDKKNTEKRIPAPTIRIFYVHARHYRQFTYNSKRCIDAASVLTAVQPRHYLLLYS